MRLTLALLAAAASSAVQGGNSPSTDEARIRQIIAEERVPGTEETHERTPPTSRRRAGSRTFSARSTTVATNSKRGTHGSSQQCSRTPCFP